MIEGNRKLKKMVKKCIYCKNEIPNESVIDFCERCGIKTWGSKMLNNIIKEMQAAENRGDLMQGSVK